jgi:hypothetical protein
MNLIFNIIFLKIWQGFHLWISESFFDTLMETPGIFKLSKFSVPNCQNFPFQTVKTFLFKLSKFPFINCQKFPFINCQKFPFINCQNFPIQTVKISFYKLSKISFYKLSKISFSKLSKFPITGNKKITCWDWVGTASQHVGN